jgi:hypothetical protein
MTLSERILQPHNIWLTKKWYLSYYMYDRQYIFCNCNFGGFFLYLQIMDNSEVQKIPVIG